ncbi:MAG: lysophospholipid acyltransferase family protein [Anaerolineae bacterium]
MEKAIHRLFYGFFRIIIGLLIKLLMRCEVVGAENVPRSGPLMVVTNHVHIFDPPVLMCTLPRRVRALVARKWWRRLGFLLGPVGCVPIYRGEVDRQALHAIFKLLEEGEVLALAPEGTRSHTASLQKGKEGAAYIATRTGVTIVPVGISGVDQTFPCWKRLRRPHVKVVIGKPFSFPKMRAKGETLERMTEEIMYRIAELLPESYRGVYGISCPSADIKVPGT